MECSYSCRLGLRSGGSQPNRVGEGKSDSQHCNACGNQTDIDSNQAFHATIYGCYFSVSTHPALSLSHVKAAQNSAIAARIGRAFPLTA
jgi:hypothetical protein